MGEMEFLGYLIAGLITLGGFVAVIQKFTQPINELRVVIQKLLDKMDTITETDTIQNKRLDKHGDEIDKLDKRVGKIETKIELYHEHKEG